MISNLARLKKMMVDKPYLYEEEEHAVVKLAEDALAFIQNGSSIYDPVEQDERVSKWLEEHK